MAGLLGWSEDALERRFADVGLSTPSAVRRLAVAAEGLWLIAAGQHAAEDVARALGLGGADSLGRVIKSVFGIGLKAARLMGPTGARRILTWTGLLAFRGVAGPTGLSSLKRARVSVSRRTVTQPAGEALCLHGVTMDPETWALLTEGGPLEHIVDRLTDPVSGSPRRFTREIIPALFKLLRDGLLAITTG